MQTEKVKAELILLIKDLYYMSESDYPFEILDWGKKESAQIKDAVLSFYEKGSVLTTINTEEFFNKIISNFKISGDDTLMMMAKKYSELLNYLSHPNFETVVYKCGKIEVGIYIIIVMKDNAVLVLKTLAIET